MKITKYLSVVALVGAITFVLSGCTSSLPIVDASGSLVDVHALQHATQPTDSVPTPEQYLLARQSFVTEMMNIMAQQEQKSNSSANKIKNAIAAGGAILSLGGTGASFVIDDESTRSSIAQVSGLVGGIAGIIGLLPIGSGTESAAIVHSFLAAEIPLFEQRWPEGHSTLTASEWILFVRDAEHMSHLVEQLSR